MDGGSAAPHVIVVHGGQIVVDQGIAMQAFQAGSGIQCSLHRQAEEGRSLYDEERAEPLATAQHGVPHGISQALRGRRDRATIGRAVMVEVGGKAGLSHAGRVVEPVCKVRGVRRLCFGVCGRERHQSVTLPGSRQTWAAQGGLMSAICHVSH